MISIFIRNEDGIGRVIENHFHSSFYPLSLRLSEIKIKGNFYANLIL